MGFIDTVIVFFHNYSYFAERSMHGLNYRILFIFYLSNHDRKMYLLYFSTRASLLDIYFIVY